jgi:hypothetical protein
MKYSSRPGHRIYFLIPENHREIQELNHNRLKVCCGYSEFGITAWNC